MTKTQASTGDRDARRGMSPEAQRIAIAEACGWKLIAGQVHPNGGIYKRGSWLNANGEYNDAIPDYLNDLNAMHAAEKVLTDAQWLVPHFQNLNSAVGSPPLRAGLKPHITATAAQRAEAFLRTLNLWKPDQSEKRDL